MSPPAIRRGLWLSAASGCNPSPRVRAPDRLNPSHVPSSLLEGTPGKRALGGFLSPVKNNEARVSHVSAKCGPSAGGPPFRVLLFCRPEAATLSVSQASVLSTSLQPSRLESRGRVPPETFPLCSKPPPAPSASSGPLSAFPACDLASDLKDLQASWGIRLTPPHPPTASAWGYRTQPGRDLLPSSRTKAKVGGDRESENRFSWRCRDVT